MGKIACEYRGDFAVLTGTTPSTTGTGITLSYPQGFNEDNCVVISFMLWDYDSNAWRAFGLYLPSAPISCGVSLTASGVNIVPRQGSGWNTAFKIVLYRFA